MSIRWRKKDEILLKRKIHNFNAKVDRLRKSNYNGYIPEKIHYKDKRKEIKERYNFNKEIKLIDNFTKRNSERIVEKTERSGLISEFMKKNIKIKLNMINRVRRKEKKYYSELMLTDRGESLGIKVGSPQAERLNEHIRELHDRKFRKKNMSNENLNEFMKSLQNYNQSLDDKMELYRRNMYKAIEKQLPTSEVEKIKEVLDTLTTKQIVDKYYTDINMDIKIWYSPTDGEVVFTQLLQAWQNEAKRLHQQKE